MPINSLINDHGQQAASRRHRTAFVVNDQQNRKRQQTENFIRRIFARAYSANIQHFLPTLISLSDDEGKLAAAAGLQAAHHGNLYLEQYLDSPIETVLAEQTGQTVARHEVIEVGNLALATRGGARQLITGLTAYLQAADFTWVVFTATPTLRNSFSRLGLTLVELTHARPERLGAAAEQWGNYYDCQPVVVAGHINSGYLRLEQHLKNEQVQNMHNLLWECAYHAGLRGQWH